MTPYTPLLLPGARRPAAIAGILLLGLGLLAHLLQLLTLGPWSISVHPWVTWPHDFHLWLLETALLVIGVVLLVVDRRRTHIRRLWRSATPLRQWAALAAVLACCQLLLLAGFWWTKDHGVAELGGLRAAFWLGESGVYPCSSAWRSSGLPVGWPGNASAMIGGPSGGSVP